MLEVNRVKKEKLIKPLTKKHHSQYEMRLTQLPIIATMLLAATICSSAQSAIESAEDLLQNKQWTKAERSYRQITDNDPSNGRAWYGLGSAALRLKDYKAARVAFQRSVDLKYNLPFSLYNLACADALGGNAPQALASLEKLVNVAPMMLTLGAAKDPDLAALREKPEFQQVLEKARTAVAPCLHDPRNRAFDFWLGDWDVSDNKSGASVGKSHIELSLDGCLLIENWSGKYGDTGKSFNHLDPESGNWRQYWVASNGSVNTYEGDIQDGVMHFTGTSRARGVAPASVRLTFRPHPDGSVEQIGEAPDTAGGWTVTYDFIYKKQK